MNLFFTGDRQIGKSTALKRLIDLCPGRVRGFATVFCDRSALPKELYIQPWGEKAVFSSDRLAARLYGDRKEVYPEVFDSIGSELIRTANGADAIIMDELGFLERDAEEFRLSVRDALLGETPVIGVIRADMSEDEGWAAQLAHVLTVTYENRDSIHLAAARMLGWCEENEGC